MKYLLISLHLIFAIQFLSSPTWAATSDKNKSLKKSEVRLTLSEWLEQKERNKMMDLWLQMNSPSPYEFGLGASRTSYLIDSHQNNLNKYNFFAFASFVGLDLNHSYLLDEGYSDLMGVFKLRFFGNSQQDTHINVGLGQLQRNYIAGGTFFKAIVYQIDWAIYFNHYFGFFGDYTDYAHTSFGNSDSIEGFARSVGLFLNFNFFQVYGKSNIEKNSFANSPSIFREGYEAGVLFYF